jgi:uncharacterized protein
MIKQQITDQIKDAMRSHDAVKLETLRFILSQIKYVEIDKHQELNDEAIIGVISNEVKKRRDAIKLFKDSGRDQLVSEEEEKLVTIMQFLPEQMSREEVEKLVDEAIAKVGTSNMGLVMKELMPQVKGKADGSMVSEVVKSKLQS